MLVIRKATAADVPRILTLIKELAEYEREPHQVIATEEDLLRDGFPAEPGRAPAFHVLLVHDGDTATAPVGFALYFYSYSTWNGRRCLFLEDLFVEPSHRGKGAGLALMRALAREAVDARCMRFVWNVLDWNQPSIDFYERLGAKVLREWLTVRLEGDALATLASAAGAERTGLRTTPEV
ncbi:MAG: GNAT family N-acetyltransferase [Deltaproteobacteria bacterium]|nr:GNAT family N-acetyltransferase [Deltaproteobacteria bacterium]